MSGTPHPPRETTREPPLDRLSRLLSGHVSLPRPGAEGSAAAALVGLLLFALFPRVAFRGEVFFERDIAILWVPQVEAFVRSVHAGSWPVWDPAVGFGHPMLANPNAQVFYPFTWLNLLIRPWRLYVLYVAVHLLLAGTGLARLGRQLGLSPAGSRLSACVWVASGPLLSFVNVWNHLAGAAWMPWVLIAARRALGSGRLSDAIRLGGMMAVQTFAGSPDLCVLTGLVVLVDLVRRLRLRGLRSWTSLVGLRSIVLAGLVCVGLSAAQWLPSLELALEGSRRTLSNEARTFWSLHPIALGQLLVPLSFAELPQWAGAAAAAHLFELWSPLLRSGYLGLAAAVFVVWCLGSPTRPERGFLLVVLVASVGGALGRHFFVHGVAAALLPPVAMLRHPAKALIVAALAWALLAGMGLDAWREGGLVSTRRRIVAALGLLAMALTAVFVAAALALPPLSWPIPQATVAWSVVLARNATPIAGAVAAALAVALFSLWNGSRRRGAGMTVLALLAVAELVMSNRGLNVTAPAHLLDRKPELLRYLDRQPPSRIYVWDYVLRVAGRGHPTQGMLGLFLDVPGGPSEAARILAMQEYLYPPAGGRWGLLGSYDRDLLGLYPRWLDNMNLLLRAVEDTPAYLRLLQMAGVHRVVALHPEHPGLRPLASIPGVFRRPIHVLEVPDPLSRVFVPTYVHGAEGDDVFRALVSEGFEPARDVVIAERPPGLPWGPTRGAARIVEDRPDRVRIEAQLDGRGVVVLLDGAARGWRAFVDSRPAPVVRANGAFRAVEVAAGRHDVEFVYRPASVLWGLGCSVVTALALFALSVRARP